MRELSARVVNKWKSKAQMKERGRRYDEGEEILRPWECNWPIS